MKHLKTHPIKENKSNPTVIELTSQLLPVINVNMYNSELDADETRFHGETEEEYEKWLENFDLDEYKKEILDACKTVLDKNLKPVLLDLNLGIKDIDYVSIWSPKQYNYGGDLLYFDLIVEEDFIDNIKKRLIVEDEEIYNEEGELSDEYDDEVRLGTFLKNEYKSYSGFISQMPETINELYRCLDGKDIERGVAAYLCYRLFNSDELYYDENSNEELLKIIREY